VRESSCYVDRQDVAGTRDSDLQFPLAFDSATTQARGVVLVAIQPGRERLLIRDRKRPSAAARPAPGRTTWPLATRCQRSRLGGRRPARRAACRGRRPGRRPATSAVWPDAIRSCRVAWSDGETESRRDGGSAARSLGSLRADGASGGATEPTPVSRGSPTPVSASPAPRMRNSGSGSWLTDAGATMPSSEVAASAIEWIARESPSAQPKRRTEGTTPTG
jgi:hypothetical protein